jgi:hypothetical protein
MAAWPRLVVETLFGWVGDSGALHHALDRA